MKKWVPPVDLNTSLASGLNDKIHAITSLLTVKSSPEEGLMRGEPGVILALFYYARTYGNETIFDLAAERLNKFIQNVELDIPSKSFASGLSGIGWLLLHLRENNFIDFEDSEVITAIDNILEAEVDSLISQANYDYLHGLVGVGLYFAQRTGYNSSQIRAIVEGLIVMLEADTGPHKLWKSDQNVYKKDAYNLSLSHGLSSILYFLTNYLKHNRADQIVDSLLQRTINFLVESKLPADRFHSYFPSAVYHDPIESGQKNSRLSWCYGDLTIAFAILNYAKVFNNDTLKELAFNILKISTGRRTFHTTGVIDAAFCHGASGIAFIYAKAYNFSGMLVFKEAANYWYEYALNQGRDPDGLAGYKTHFGAYGWTKQDGILEGISGIMLTYMAALTNAVPSWDACFLLDI